MITGLSHLTFIVNDLDRMEDILVSVLKAEKVYDSNGRQHSLSAERFFIVGEVWVAIMQGESLPARSYNHVAFAIADDNYDEALSAIERLGLEVRPGRSRVPGEGRSIYFHDHDNHLFELHSGTLDSRLESYRRLAAADS
jgi:catechol 2,3-dioxygenase-like lactoylglutathione lyase family enzyme